MVPRVAKKGKSFKGAGLYYLHDKKASTAERVAFTHTENLPTDDAELALKVMAYTALSQDHLKAQSGVKATGRKLVNSVYCYSLSWAPDEQPTREDMIAAAKETLNVLGLTEHEALLVAHNDEPHPHIHVIANRVDPTTGLAAKLSKDHLDLSKWAEEYERSRGKILCDERVANNAARYNDPDKTSFVKEFKSLDKKTFHLWRRERLTREQVLRDDEWKTLSAKQKQKWADIYAEKEERIADRRARLKEQYRPEWAALFRRQKAEKMSLDIAMRTPISRLGYWLKSGDKSLVDPKRGMISRAWDALSGRTDYRAALLERHQKERKTLSTRVSGETRRIFASENEYYRTQGGRLKNENRAERDALKSQQKDRRAELWKETDAKADEHGLSDDERRLDAEYEKRIAEEIAELLDEEEKGERAKKNDDHDKDKDFGNER